ncbi:hypothetical protein M5K25_021316 [Dendrobium thyrsiflorum]|uniref:acyl-CoA oxidase n=1 Tax=Dendrobium thyrsiflorum TaxID=117978 RepID=A0ABD0UCC0_DENTH
MDLSASSSASERVSRRAAIIIRHLREAPGYGSPPIVLTPCISYSPPESSEKVSFDTRELRLLLDGHDVEARDWVFRLMEESSLFCPRRRGGNQVFVAPDYNQSMEQQREMTMRRIQFLLERGVFDGWLTDSGVDLEMRKLAMQECIGLYDHSLAIKLGVHFFLWGAAIQFFGTKRHHDKFLRESENYLIKGCFAMTELGHGSNVRGIETIATFDKNTQEFFINSPCESAQKYWIGGAAKHATHTIIFSQLHINGTSQGVHAFIGQIRDANGNIMSNVRIADCGHKIGLNGVDNGRIWFDNFRVPRENLLNSVADVLPDGQYVSAIKDPDQRFAAFLAPLTSGRVIIAVNAVYISKMALAIAVRYGLTRRAFSLSSNEPEVLLLDYPSHQRRLLPLIAKTCAMSIAANNLKKIYVKRSPDTSKILHIYSSAYKATFTWQNMKTLQECREACGGQGLKTENRIGILKGEFDVQSTFEGDNNVLMQQVSKALLSEYISAQKKKQPFKGLGLEHMNSPCPVIPANLTSSSLRSIEFQNDVFCLRERDLLNRYASEVYQYQQQGKSRETAVLLSYQLAEDLARAFTERTILQLLIEKVKSATGPLKDVLELLRSMYALICIEEDASFLRYGYVALRQLLPLTKTHKNSSLIVLVNQLRSTGLLVLLSQGVHAFIGQIRDANGNIMPNVRIADCGHKIGLNGVDNGRIWFDNFRVPRENLLNSVADVLPDGQYIFAAFLAPLTSGRVNIAVHAVYISKMALAIALRYGLTRRAFSLSSNEPEVLLLDYPSHQRRLLPLIAKTCAMSIAANNLKKICVKRSPDTSKILHIYSSAYKATFSWQNMKTLQECREACGGQGFKTENRIGILKGEFDVQSTFEGDNNVLMQQVSKALLSEYISAQKKKQPFKGLGLEHMNSPCPVIPANLTSSALRSIEFQNDVFCLRERDLLNRYASEVYQYQQQGKSRETAVLLSYQLAEDLARAFTERTILQLLIEKVKSATGPLKDVLELLRSMYALICIEEDASFLRYGYLSLSNAAAVRKEVMKLCGNVRPHALALVNSFGIPDSFLSPIAFDWIEANSWTS